MGSSPEVNVDEQNLSMAVEAAITLQTKVESARVAFSL